MKRVPESLRWTSHWTMFVAYTIVFLGATMLPIWPPLRPAALIFGAASAFGAGTMRQLDATRPLWDPEWWTSWRADAEIRQLSEEPTNPEDGS